MKITYDKKGDALYFYANKGKVFKTVAVTNQLIVDFNKTGKILGVELLGASFFVKNKKVPKTMNLKYLK